MKNVLLTNLSISILSFAKTDLSLTFDFGLMKKYTNVDVIEKFRTIDLMANLTEQLLSHKLHHCVESSLQENEINTIDSMLQDEFEDLLSELNLFFPKHEETLWYLTFTNCYLYSSICGSEEKSCFIHDRNSPEDIKSCLDGDYTGKAPNYFPNNTWSSNIYNNYAKSSFTMGYKSHNKQTEPAQKWAVVHDEDLNTAVFADFNGHSYEVEFTYKTTWTGNDGFGLVTFIMSGEGSKNPTFYEEKYDLKVKGRYQNNELVHCTINFLEESDVDYSAISFSCPKQSVKYFKCSLTVNSPLRIHEIQIARQTYDEFVQHFNERSEEMRKNYHERENKSKLLEIPEQLLI